jgi:hypothetical protein
MSLTATAHSTGDTFRHDVLIDGRHRLITNEPERLGDTDHGPAPHELLHAALAACVANTIRTSARTKGWELGELVRRRRLRQHRDAPTLRRDHPPAGRPQRRAGAAHHARRRDLPRTTRDRSRLTFDEHVPDTERLAA